MSKQPDGKPTAPLPPSAARRPPAGSSARPPAPSRPAPGTRPPSAGSTPQKGSGAVQKGAATRPTKLTTSRPVTAPTGRTLRPLDLGLITAGILVVGVLIWFATGGLNGTSTNSATSGTSGALTPAAGAGAS